MNKKWNAAPNPLLGNTRLGRLANGQFFNEEPVDPANPVDPPAPADKADPPEVDPEIDPVVDPVDPEPTGKTAAELQTELEAKNALVTKLRERERLAEKYEKYGKPEDIAKIKDELEKQREEERRSAAEKSRAEKEAREKYEKELRKKDDVIAQKEQENLGIRKRIAVQQWFNKQEVKGVPSEFEKFYGLTRDRFKYDSETDAITEVYGKDGKALFNDGQIATPDILMLSIRKGDEGMMLANAFEPFNQSSGAGRGPGQNGRTAQWGELNTTGKYMAGFQDSGRG